VGGETDIHQFHEVLINASPVVAFRELDIPDLAYWLDPFEPDEKCGPLAHPPEGILVIPNVEVLPQHNDPHWKHASWEHFKNEFAQALDTLVDKGHKLTFLSMCDATKKKDVWAIHELMGRLALRDDYPVYSTNPLWIARLMRHHQVIVTQRYHGIIMAESAGVPYVSISHHDKLRLTHPHRGPNISYYATQKDPLVDTIETAMAMRIDPYRPPRAVYDDVISRIAAVIKEHG
jgi:exopolysaccharide biosynthesis predicted pyruvyltransferase EpsI